MKLSYANVMATVAVVMALGGTATAAVTLPRNSVGSKQIKNGQVRSRDIRNATVTGADVRPGSLTGAHVADGSLASADVADGSLGGADVADGSLGGADVHDGSLRGADVGDGSLGGADLANGAVRGAKIADESVTGADVKESTLATVPNASRLDGIDSTGLSRSGGRVFSDGFTDGAGDLELGVPGYGTFFLFCTNNNTPGVPGDDLVRYGYSHDLGNNAVQGMRATFADNVLDDGETTLFNPDAPQNNLIFGADRVEVDQYLRSRSGDKAIRISAWGFDDETSTTDCTGMIEAQILR
jgi:hypothetical protein